MTLSQLKQVDLYTDGACIGNPGPGGYGVILSYKAARKEMSGGARLTTNNRMELLAVVKGLEALKEACAVQLYSDSEYVVKGMREGWASAWKSNGWRKKDKTKALNVDLWKRLLDLTEVHQVSFHWVRGHDGHPENERCDSLAVLAAKGSELPPDIEYERLQSASPGPLSESPSARKSYPNSAPQRSPRSGTGNRRGRVALTPLTQEPSLERGPIARFIDPVRAQYEQDHWRNRKDERRT